MLDKWGLYKYRTEPHGGYYVLAGALVTTRMTGDRNGVKSQIHALSV